MGLSLIKNKIKDLEIKQDSLFDEINDINKLIDELEIYSKKENDQTVIDAINEYKDDIIDIENEIDEIDKDIELLIDELHNEYNYCWAKSE